MSLAPIPLAPLQPGQRTILHLEAAMPAFALMAGGIALGLVAQARLGWPAWPIGGAVAAVALWALLIAPRRRWAAWGWALDEDEMHVGRGVWTRKHTVVPILRVQHIDIAQGPLERVFGLARLVLHTAGTESATVVVPGLSRPDAEALRETIRARIRTEPW